MGRTPCTMAVAGPCTTLISRRKDGNDNPHRDTARPGPLARLSRTDQAQGRGADADHFAGRHVSGDPRGCAVDRRIDAVMARTHKRPMAEGRISPLAALAFALLLAVVGLVLLLAFTNPLTAWLTLASLLGYAVIYTGFLKRATPQNIVIGGLAGAAPPLLGWVAITGHVSAEPLLLVLIIFAWTPPHFWALAIHRKEEYAKADIPMLPVTHGERYTKMHIVLYTCMLLAVSMLPYAIHMSGVLYLLCALVLGARFLHWAWVLYRGTRPHAAIGTFKYSIYYLFLLFIALLVDHYLLLAL